MPESTLTISWQELMSRVGSFLGWGRGTNYGDPAYTSQQLFELNGIVASGLRQFYYPEPQQGAAASYEWSFLRPTAQLALAANLAVVPLPDDYGGVDGPITVVTAGTTAQPWRIEWRNLGILQEMFQSLPVLTGPPQYVCEQPLKGTGPTQGQRFQFLVFPKADQAYTLQMNYNVNPDYLTQDLPYAYGGSQHAETILESCYAVAEARLDDQPRGTGPHSILFASRLAASIGSDRKHKPQKLGPNRDRSDDLTNPWNPHYYAPAATYNGGSFG